MSETILVADPNIEFLDHTRLLLERKGYNFIQATNGEEAKLKLEMDQIDLFFVNAMMPAIDGPTLCDFVKYELQKPIPTVLMVSQGVKVPLELKDKADTILQRPLRQKELSHCLRSVRTIRSLLMKSQELRRRLGDDSIPAPPPAAAPAPQPVAAPEVSEPEGPLYPMSWFRKLAALEVKRSIHFHQPLSLLLLSYDLTEEYIQEAPKETLLELSESLAYAVSQTAREIDIPVQFSRDHILLLLANTGIEGAIQEATRIRGAIKNVLQQSLSPELLPPQSLSIGATTSSTQGVFKFTDLLRDATRALREVRAQGGDGVFYC